MGFQYSEQGNDHSYDYDDPMALPCLTQDPIFCPYPTDFYVPLCAASYDYDLHRKKSMLIVVVAVLLVLLRLNLDDSSAMIMMTFNSIVDHICTFHLFSASSNQLILFFSRQNGQSTHAYTLYLLTSPYLSV